MSEELKAALARIACLEGEIAKRDARIAELEKELQAGATAAENCELFRAELAAIKAQEPSYHVRALNDALAFGIGMIKLNSDGSSEHVPAESIYAAPVSEAKAQGVVMPDVNAAAKALCNRHAMICGVDEDDQWKEYSQDFIADAETVLANARLNAAPVQQVSVPDVWRKSLSELVDAMRRYEMDVDSEFGAPYSHKEMMIRAMQLLAADPAAPAAVAGLVEALEIAVDYLNSNALSSIASGSTCHRKMRAALAANRAKGVV